jgi:hypothetical protein
VRGLLIIRYVKPPSACSENHPVREARPPLLRKEWSFCLAGDGGGDGFAPGAVGAVAHVPAEIIMCDFAASVFVNFCKCSFVRWISFASLPEVS